MHTQKCHDQGNSGVITRGRGATEGRGCESGGLQALAPPPGTVLRLQAIKLRRVLVGQEGV